MGWLREEAQLLSSGPSGQSPLGETSSRKKKRATPKGYQAQVACLSSAQASWPSTPTRGREKEKRSWPLGPGPRHISSPRPNPQACLASLNPLPRRETEERRGSSEPDA